jgi:hypothetical protein
MSVSHPTADTTPDDTANHQRIELWMRAHPTSDVQDRQQAALDRLSRLKTKESSTNSASIRGENTSTPEMVIHRPTPQH